MSEADKRVFLGLEIEAPWPMKLPKGRLLDEKHRHVTLAFLGSVDWIRLQSSLGHFPHPDFQIGPSGKFSRCLFLPPRHPHVVAWEAEWMDDFDKKQIPAFQKQLVEWLKSETFHPDDRHSEWLPHMTMARSPFDFHEWKSSFMELPFISRNIHLYESMGHSHYEPRWTFPFLAPFDEIEHTADIAFKVRGETIEQLFKNAFLAMSFHYPQALAYYAKPDSLKGVDDIVQGLNALITKIDGDIGMPLKAVSYHGEITTALKNTLEWEMIIDV